MCGLSRVLCVHACIHDRSDDDSHKQIAYLTICMYVHTYIYSTYTYTQKVLGSLRKARVSHTQQRKLVSIKLSLRSNYFIKLLNCCLDSERYSPTLKSLSRFLSMVIQNDIIQSLNIHIKILSCIQYLFVYIIHIFLFITSIQTRFIYVRWRFFLYLFYNMGVCVRNSYQE